MIRRSIIPNVGYITPTLTLNDEMSAFPTLIPDYHHPFRAYWTEHNRVCSCCYCLLLIVAPSTNGDAKPEISEQDQQVQEGKILY